MANSIVVYSYPGDKLGEKRFQLYASDATDRVSAEEDLAIVGSDGDEVVDVIVPRKKDDPGVQAFFSVLMLAVEAHRNLITEGVPLEELLLDLFMRGVACGIHAADGTVDQ